MGIYYTIRTHDVSRDVSRNHHHHLMHLACCVCGEWDEQTALVPVDAELALDKGIRRRYVTGTLKEKLLCAACRASCGECGLVITVHQKRAFDRLCAVCTAKKSRPKGKGGAAASQAKRMLFSGGKK